MKRSFDWRLLIVVVLFLNLAGFFWIPEILGVSRQKLFHFAGVAALEVPFMDLRGVATWCEAAASGIDPAVTQTSITLPNGTRQSNFLMNDSPAAVCTYSYWTFFSGEESLRNAIFKQGIMWLVFVISSLLCGALLARLPGFLKNGEVS